jgi:hypothetical protein
LPIRRNTPPWDYLHQASIPSLQSYELSRLNHAANTRREVGALIEQWVEDLAHALLAQWVREDRSVAPQSPAAVKFDRQTDLPFKEPPAAEPARRAGAIPARFAQRDRVLARS